MKTLAVVVYTIVAPAEFAGEQLVTIDPVPCAQNMDVMVAIFEAEGFTVSAQCEYTHAPERSPRPKRREGNG